MRPNRKAARFELAGKRVWVAGHGGLVGSAIMRRLSNEKCEILTVVRAEVDLRRQSQVEQWMDRAEADVVIVAAATVGGISANDRYPVDFLYDNLAIETNIIHSAYQTGVKKLLLLGSSCIYPKMAPQPIPEEAFMTGPLEPTNEWYAIAKIAGIRLCQAYRQQYGCDFISAMPTSLYGPGDNFDPAAGHVIPAFISKSHLAKISGARDIEVWGTGKPLREFLYVEDAADALIFLLEHYSQAPHVNIGTGTEVSITELAKTVSDVVGFSGGLRYLADRPDGTPRKLLECGRMTAMGWKPQTTLRDGLERTYRWYLDQVLSDETADK